MPEDVQRKMAEPPKDFIGQTLFKVMGGRGPADFVPTLLPPEIKSPAELMADESKGNSVPGIVEKFIPIDAPKAVGDIGEDVYRAARSLTPQHVFAKGRLDLPEPKALTEIIKRPQALMTKDLTLQHPAEFFGAPKGLPGLPPLPPPPQQFLPAPPGFKN
jgi:hypothetical protein